jgi:hypothetical protein
MWNGPPPYCTSGFEPSVQFRQGTTGVILPTDIRFESTVSALPAINWFGGVSETRSARKLDEANTALRCSVLAKSHGAGDCVGVTFQ